MTLVGWCLLAGGIFVVAGCVIVADIMRTSRQIRATCRAVQAQCEAAVGVEE